MKTKLLLFIIFLLTSIQMKAEDGDSFTALTNNGLEMSFVIVSEENQTVKVGNGTDPAISPTTTGNIIIPSSAECNGNIYKVVSVSANAFKNCTGITVITLEEGITSLGQYSFSGCTSLETVTIPAGVQTIPAYCFNGCRALSNITLPEEVLSLGSYAFSKCSALTSIQLPNSLTTIGAHAFESCGLRSIVIPENVTSIQTYAFNANSKLVKVISRIKKPFVFGSASFANINSLCGLHVPEGTKAAYVSKGWKSTVFKGGVVEGDETPTKGYTFIATTDEGIDVTYMLIDVETEAVAIGNGSSTAITSDVEGQLTLSPNVQHGDYSFKVTTISTKAFLNCTQIESVVLPTSLTAINSQAFNGCKGLVSVYARMEVPFALQADAFSNISNYCGLHVPEGKEVDYKENGWTKDIFKGGVVEGDDAITGGYKFTQTNSDGVEITYVVVDIDEKTVQVGDDITPAVSNDISGNVLIPSAVTFGDVTYSVTSIGTGAFEGCSGITGMLLNDGLRQISSNAFKDCVGLTEFTIPSSVTNIGANAFNGCTNLAKIKSQIVSPFVLSTNAFAGISAQSSLHVPEGTKQSYTEAGWTSKIFSKGVVEGDDTLLNGDIITKTNEDGINIIYKILDVDDMSVSVGDGQTPAISQDATGTISIPSTIEHEGLTYNVKTLAVKSFNACTGINKVVFPNSLSEIGANAFSGCTKLTSVLISEGLTSIGAYSFSNCKSLNTIDLPSSLKSIGGHAFESTGLTSIILPENVTSIGTYAFNSNGQLLKVIARMQNPFVFGSAAFANIGSLCSLHVPDGKSEAYISKGWTKKIFKGGVVEGDDTLAGGDIIHITTEDGVDLVCQIVDIEEKTVRVGNGNSVAIDKERTGSVTIPSTVVINEQQFSITSIGKNAFYGCALSSVTFPETITSIGDYAFFECASLKNVEFPTGLNSIGTNAFAYTGLTSVVIPEGVTTIEIATFADCYFMTSVTIPNSVKKILRQAFRHNLRLTTVNLPEGLTEFGAHAFYNCQSLKEITLPSTLTVCKDHVFYYCVSLNKVISHMEDPFQMPTGMFEECPSSLGLHIPDGTYDKYAAAGWVPEIFPGGIVYGDDTPTLNETFTFKTIEGVEVTAVLTNIEKKTIQVGLGTSGNPAIDQATQGVVTLPDTVEAFGQKYVITTIGGYAFRYCNDVTEVKIPATVTHIGRYGFGNMDNLAKAVLPDSLKAMETAAFYKDEALKELTLNEGLEDIGNYAFSYAAIRELEIPATVTNIGRNSFAACGQLDKVISRIETAYAFQDGAFAQISGTCGLHLPEGTKEAYIEQGWTEETFPGGIVYGDETLHKGQSFDVTEEDGTQKTFRVTDVNEMKAEMVSVKAGSEAGGTVTLMPTATHELTGNVYTVSSIADKAFGADVKKVLSRIETPFAVPSAAFASLSPMCSLHVPAGTKAAYLEQGWTEESFKAGVVEGDDTLVKGQTFTLTDEDGTSTTYRVTDVNDNLVEIVSAKEGEEADGRVSIQQAVTDPVAGNDYTVGSIGNGAFNENLKAVTAEAETPYSVTPEAFKGIGDKCVLFVPAGTKDAYIENGWTEDIFKGGIYEGNIPGDVNEDLAVDISDIVAVINTIADPEGSAYRYADVNEDGKVDISDIVKIINIIAEK